MQKALLLGLLIFIFVDLKAQTNVYHPFPGSNAIWREYSGGYQCSCCADYQYIITGDTIIGNITYHKLNLSGVDYGEDPQGYCNYIIQYSFSHYAGAIREDRTYKRVYFRDPHVNSDTLLYDFNLKLGDTLPPSLINNKRYHLNYVFEIDSILIGKNYHKRFGITDTSVDHHNDSYVYLIEGIGGTFGLFGVFYPPFEMGSRLLCFKQNGQTVFPDTTTKCNIVTDITTEKGINYSFNISPNPLFTFANITISPELHNADIILFDLYGREQKRFSNVNSDTKIERGNLPVGLYFYKVVEGNKVIHSGKLIVD